jgi:hypothetical protein
MKTRTATRALFLVALMLSLGVASVYAQPGRPMDVRVKVTFSGNAGPSPINLNQPNTSTVEESVAGDGTLGPFTALPQMLRIRPARARAFSFQEWPARAYFASRMGVY